MRGFRWVAPWAIWAGFVAVSMLAAERSAEAATAEEKAGARAAATQGEAAFDAKRWAEAVDLFSRAESLVHSPVHLLYKARALTQLGQLVKARETFLEIVHDQSSSPALAKAQESAKTELSALEPRLVNVDIKVDGPGAANANVTMDGEAVPSALIGISHPVDPGEHKFQASSSGAESDPVMFSMKEGGTGTVTLTLHALAGAEAPVAPAADTAPAVAPASPPLADATTSSGGTGMRAGAYVALGVGVVGLAAGTLFALKAKSKYDDGNALCASDPCSLTRAQADQYTQFGKDGDSAKTLSLVGFIVGGVGVVTGTTLLVLSGHKSEASQARVEPWIGLGSLGVNGKF